MSNVLRVLVVDDDENIALALKLIIGSAFPCEYVHTAADGMQAWEMLQENAYDLVVSDWNMPRLDGNQLLHRMKQSEQVSDIPFLMLTMRKDVSSVASAIKAGIADYIIKPFDRDVLINKIEKLLAGKEGWEHLASPLVPGARPVSGNDEIDQKSISLHVMEIIGKGSVTLPTMPQVLFAIQDEMKKEGAGIRDIAQLIEMDPGISSKLIGVANSVYYHGMKECTLVEDAVARLGLESTRQFVYMVGNKNLYAWKNRIYEDTVRELYLHSLACAAVSQSLAEQLRLADAHAYFALGLFHDIGKLLVLKVLSDLTMKTQGMNLTLSLEIMNALHTKAGFMLLSKWSFPPIYASVALNHEDLEAEPETPKELLVVHFSNLFVRELGYSLRIETVPNLLQTQAAQILKLNDARLQKAAEDAESLIKKATSML